MGGVEGGTDTLTGIEDLSFTDGRLTFARDGQAAFCLGTSKSPWGPFSDVATVALAARADIPSSDLHFVPSRAGRGLRPRGVIHALRRGVYAASQWARDLTTRPTAQRATT